MDRENGDYADDNEIMYDNEKTSDGDASGTDDYVDYAEDSNYVALDNDDSNYVGEDDDGGDNDETPIEEFDDNDETLIDDEFDENDSNYDYDGNDEYGNDYGEKAYHENYDKKENYNKIENDDKKESNDKKDDDCTRKVSNG